VLESIYDWNEDDIPMHFWDMPMICNPNYYDHVFKKIIELSKSLSCSNLDTMNFALRFYNMIDKVVPLPDIVWTVGLPYLYPLQKFYDNKGRIMLYAARDRVFSFHKKWWHDGVCYAYYHDKEKISKENTLLMRDIYREMCTKYNFVWNY
jgi:hypothetical protein